MRRDFVAQAARFVRRLRLLQLVQLADLGLQKLHLLLLAKYRAIECVFRRNVTADSEIV